MYHPYSAKTEVLHTEKATGFLLAATKNNDIVELEIQENGELPEHALPIDVTFYVIAGKGTLSINGKATSARAGDVLEVEKNLNRGWLNPHPETLKLLVIKQKAT